MGDGNRFENGRALTLPCEFDSRSFRCVESEVCNCTNVSGIG